MPKQSPINIDPNSPLFGSLDEAANAFGATFPNADVETAGMLYKDADGKYRYSTTIPGTDEHFELRALVPKGASLGAIVHSHPGKDQYGQVFSPDDLKTADLLKLPSYVRFLQANQMRVYRPGITPTEKMQLQDSRFGATVARGDALTLPPPPPTLVETPDPVVQAKMQIAQQLQGAK
jgi:hypothetical protein